MVEKKRRIIIPEFEQRILAKTLVGFENQLMADSKTTENIDDLILNRPYVLTTGRLCIGRQRIMVTCILEYKMLK